MSTKTMDTPALANGYIIIGSSGIVGAIMVDQRFPKSRRLLRRGEFQQVFKEGRVRKDARLVAYLLPVAAAETRMGIVVGRGFRGSVVRNRIKRLIREAFRTVRTELAAGHDVILLPRQGATFTLAGLQESVRRLLSRPLTPPKEPAKP